MHISTSTLSWLANSFSLEELSCMRIRCKASVTYVHVYVKKELKKILAVLSQVNRYGSPSILVFYIGDQVARERLFTLLN
jgi:hypothetical protein